MPSERSHEFPSFTWHLLHVTPLTLSFPGHFLHFFFSILRFQPSRISFCFYPPDTRLPLPFTGARNSPDSNTFYTGLVVLWNGSMALAVQYTELESSTGSPSPTLNTCSPGKYASIYCHYFKPQLQGSSYGVSVTHTREPRPWQESLLGNTQWKVFRKTDPHQWHLIHIFQIP